MNQTQQLELSLSSSRPGVLTLEQWMKQHNSRKDALRRHDRDEAPYNPRQLRRYLLQRLSLTEWTGFIDLADETEEAIRQSTDATNRVLELLERLGRVEKTPLYFYPCTGGLITPDRTIHPGYEHNQYQGFEFGYRLRVKGAKP